MLGGTVGTIHLGHEATRGFDPVATAVEECYGTTRSLKSNTRHCLKFSQCAREFNAVLYFSVIWVTRYLVVPLFDVLLIVSVGQSVSSNGWREYQDIVRRMVATRFTSTYLTRFRSITIRYEVPNVNDYDGKNGENMRIVAH